MGTNGKGSGRGKFIIFGGALIVVVASTEIDVTKTGDVRFGVVPSVV